MRTITAEIQAFIPDRYGHYTPYQMINEMKPEEALNCMMFYTNPISNWTKVGKATITVTFDEDDTIVNNMVDTLKAKKSKVLADAQVEANAIDQKIQSLLAIEQKVEA